MIKAIFIDFDGTLADSKKIVFNIIKDSLHECGYDFGKRYKNQIGDLSLMRDLKIHKAKNVTRISDVVNERVMMACNDVKLVEGVQTLSKIKKPLIIVSNNNKKYIQEILKKNKMNFFKGIYSASNYYSKSELIKELMEKRKIKFGEAIYVGDKAMDAQVARDAGCFSVVICQKASWGKRSDIVKAKPDFIITNLSQLKEITNKLNSS